jgi:hypothetical protein
MITLSRDLKTGAVVFSTDGCTTENKTYGPVEIQIARSMIPKLSKPCNRRRIHLVEFSEWYREHGNHVFEVSDVVAEAIGDISVPDHIVTIRNRETFVNDVALHMYNTFDASFY